MMQLGNLFLIVQFHLSKLFLILKSGVNHTSRGSLSTSTLPSLKLRKCSSKSIQSVLSFISGSLGSVLVLIDRKRGSAGMPTHDSYAVVGCKNDDTRHEDHDCGTHCA